MAKNKKKKGRKAPLTTEKPKTSYVFREPWRSRECDPKLIKTIEGLDWHPRRCYIAYDWDESTVCLIFPEPLDNNLWRYFEFEMNNSRGAHLLWGREIEELLKKAKKAGRRRRVL